MVRSNRAPQSSSSQTRSGASCAWATAGRAGDGTYYDPLVHKAQLLYLVARHFPARLAQLQTAGALRTLSEELTGDRINSLQAGYTYGKYLEDAEGHADVQDFIRQIQQEDAQRAVRCHEFLAQLTKDGIG